jgi:hypothetical protein
MRPSGYVSSQIETSEMRTYKDSLAISNRGWQKELQHILNKIDGSSYKYNDKRKAIKALVQMILKLL